MTSVLSRTRLLSRFKLNTAVPLVQIYARKMSERADTVLNASDSWFNKYNSFWIDNVLSKPDFGRSRVVSRFRYVAVEDAPDGIFKGVSDRFNGITVDSNLETCHPEQFSSVLQSEYLHKYKSLTKLGQTVTNWNWYFLSSSYRLCYQFLQTAWLNVKMLLWFFC